MRPEFDLTQVPFSRAGSYLALSLRDTDAERPWDQRPGDALYLRTLHGDRETDRVFRVEVLAPNGEPTPFLAEARPGLLTLHTGGDCLECCLTSDDGLRVRSGKRLGLRLTLVRVGSYGNAQPCDMEGRWVVNAWPARLFCRLTPLRGRLTVDAPAENALRARHVVADFLPAEVVPNGFEALIETFATERDAEPSSLSFKEEATATAREFGKFRSTLPLVPDKLRPTAELAAYVQWSSIVAPSGHLRGPAMLMSKNHMSNVWSWDHCFNALALMSHDPKLAWDQFLIPFDHFDYQDEASALPDSVNDATIVRGFTKPPIHGWALRGMIERDMTGFLTAVLPHIYDAIACWTRWWLRFRDQDGDGVPQYNHGNDSGWDNATPFDVGFPVESPDLCAYLILQMDLLADLARRQGEEDKAEAWTRDADALLARLVSHSWREDRGCFVAPQSQTHAAVPIGESDSLLNFLPLVLGERLPIDLRRPLIDGLLAPGRFLTDFGLASESLASPRYETDGYWRGPVWAPPQLLIADGLRRMGETDAARAIAARFCRAVVQSGCAENFDARTGAGLRDRAYTWTASVFLLFAREYLTQSDLTGESS